MSSVWSKFCSALRAFRTARGGNVAITFALATLPIIAAVGAAIDYSRANAFRVAMQSALDSTALMLSKEASTDTVTQLQTNADKYFKALFTPTYGQNIQVNAGFTSGSTVMVVSATAEIPTAIMGIMGISKIDVTASSTAKWGETRLRVALVLDNTGSMGSDGKMAALQAATKSLLTQLQAAVTTPGDVYVSIIPFVKDVNLGTSNYNSDWVYWGTLAQDPTLSDNNSWDANNGDCSVGNYSPRSSCVSHGSCSISGKNSQNSCTSAGVCSNPGQTSQNSCTGSKACSDPRYSSKNSCQNHGATWDYGNWIGGVWTAATWAPKNHNTWNGCAMDRGFSSTPDATNNYDTNSASPLNTINSSLYPAEQYSSCPQAVMALSYDWNYMNSLVDAMSPAGNTNQGLGLQLGWMTLVGGGGMYNVPPKNPNYKYTEAIILLTDGLNTQNRWYTNQGSIDSRQQLTCNNINAAGITLYTIQVNTGGDPTSTLLKNCAGSPGKYPDSSKFFLLTSANQLLSVFTQIGTELSQLRIAQ
jgi:Flp pilus assembly protein TadG